MTEVNSITTNSLYTVQSGDTLWKISKERNIDYTQLCLWNTDIDINKLKIGDKVKLSAPQQPEKPKSTKQKTYKINTGDTLSKIAKQHHRTVEQLLKANPQIKNKDHIDVGKTITIPPPVIEQPKDAKSIKEFYTALGMSESSGNYKAQNRFGYLGKYQMGEQALTDAGYYTKKATKQSNYNNDWSGTFTGKDGVKSKEDFLNNPTAQENAQVEFLKTQWKYLKANGSIEYLGEKINGIKITPSALLGGAHLIGAAKVHKFLESKGKTDSQDKNGVAVSSYLKKFEKYDVSSITQEKKTPISLEG